jgi:hypothetical protein
MSAPPYSPYAVRNLAPTGGTGPCCFAGGVSHDQQPENKQQRCNSTKHDSATLSHARAGVIGVAKHK